MDQVDHFKIYIDRLRDGKREELVTELDPSFLEVEETDLLFLEPVVVNGEAYTTDDSLVLHLDSDTCCQRACSICNEPVKVPLEVRGFYHIETFDQIKSGKFDYSFALREALLLEVPDFVECNEGACKGRPEIERYLREPGESDRMDGNPFAELTLESKEEE